MQRRQLATRGDLEDGAAVGGAQAAAIASAPGGCYTAKVPVGGLDQSRIW